MPKDKPAANPVVPFVRYPSLNFSRRGSTWKITHKDEAWPLTLYARDIYPGTARLLSTITLDRQDPGMPAPTRILTASIDLLVAARRKGFAEEAAGRLARASESTNEKDSATTTAITAMLDALLERLSEDRYDLEITSMADVELPGDLTPRYAVWPIVPVPRPGLLVASSGSGKSTLAAGLAIAVVTGVNIVPGTEARVQGAVMYIGQEEDVAQMKARTSMLLRGHQIDSDLADLYYVKLRGGSLIDSAEMVAEACATYKIKMVIVDSAQATWGGDDNNGVREHASRWYGAVEMLDTPTLVIDHPSLAGMKAKAGAEMFTAGSGVKRDRSGHVWGASSIEVPVPDGQPYKYNVTLRDQKRNYVGRQPDIHYETIVYKHEWSKFIEADELDATAVVEGSRTFAAVASIMREPDDLHEDGWTSVELSERLKMKDDRRVRTELDLGQWRPAPWSTEEEITFAKVEGTGTRGRGNPARYLLEKRRVAVQLSIVPGEDEYVN